MDLLSLEREAVYRRLRKDVIFSIYEIAKIANAWNISLDAIFGLIPDKTCLFQIDLLGYEDPTEQDIEVMTNYLNFLSILTTSPKSEYMEISNSLPRSLFAGFPMLAKFYAFKWMYQYGNQSIIPFSQMMFSKKLLQIGEEYYNKIKQIANVSYIWDNMIIQYLVNDIQYFSSIYLLADEEIQLLKENIYSFLKYMEEIASKGCFPDTKNKVDLFISRINIDTNYSYFYSETIKISGIRLFIKEMASSTDQIVFENFKNRMLAKKRSSVQISGVDEKQRIEFFKKQRELVNSI
jgi:hypothetical protein